MAKKIKSTVSIQIEAGKASPAPPIGPSLAPHGINLMMFCKEYNARTRVAGRLHHPGQDHGLQRQLVHLLAGHAAHGATHPQGRRR